MATPTPPAGGPTTEASLDLPALIVEAPRSALRVTAWASLVGNIAIVVTGGAVRLTGSGLGCPTWPRCTDTSLVAHPDLGLHGAIEFGNRLLGVLLALVVVANLALALTRWRRDRGIVVLAFFVAFSVPAQAVMGGITVLTGLNPWVVGLHFLLSPALIALCVVFLNRVRRGRSTGRRPLPRATTWLIGGVAALTAAVLATGTVVTGSGPHAGDAGAARNGLSPLATSQLHADLVCLLVGLTVGTVAVAFALGDAELRRWSVVALLVELAQGLVGAVQYATSLPIALVGLHLLGAALVAAVATRLVLAAFAFVEQAA
jgi:cytochrome c oxidase assembly protein subunit 15